MAYLKWAVLIILLVFVIGGVWLYSHRVFNGQDYSLEIEKIILESKNSNRIDLTQFKPGVWDEMVIWYPYSDVRDFKIDGICLMFESSNISSDDGNNVFLFIKNNKIKGYAVVKRKDVDFTSLDLGAQRIVREKATFLFDGSVEFPKVQFLGGK
jgi:hypothetical protein